MSKLHILKVVKPLQNFNLTLKNTRGPESKDSGDIFFWFQAVLIVLI